MTKTETPMDPFFTVELVEQMPNPQRSIYVSLHTDYSEDFVMAKPGRLPSEEKAGEIIVNRLLAGGRGHFGPLETPQIILNAGWFPHSTMQQLRTHRISVSFDVQSFRYSGSRIIDVVDGKRTVEEVFYLRPLGFYTDRQGKKYEYTQELREQDLDWCERACKLYADRISQGFSEEHARGLIPFDVRQHWVLAANVRSFLHIIDMRWKLDAQLECQQFCELAWPIFKAWVPAIAEWYEANRLHKARLAP